jgi:GNAT superfamily N-acetyltransferase
MTYLTVPLANAHKKEDFTCGEELLDNYLRRQARQDIKRKLSTCFILADDDHSVRGYYTLSSTSVKRELVPEAILKKMPPSYTDLPATLLGRLAMDKSWSGQGLGEQLLLDAMKRSYAVSITGIGSMAIIVDPINERAASFYAKYGFIQLPDSGKMFIGMETIAALFK